MAEPNFHRSQCPVLVLRLCDAQVTGDVLAESLRDDLLERVERAGAANVVLDMKAVTYLSSTGISPLLALAKVVRSNEGRLALAGLTPDVLGVLVATRLVSSERGVPAPFETHADVPSAVASIYGAGG